MDALGGAAAVTANTSSGFPAASLDLGRLKTALETAVARMNMTQVRERWNDDLREWMLRAIVRWVQRCKEIRIEPRELGIRVELETQDDLGYYSYRFSVMPGRDDE